MGRLAGHERVAARRQVQPLDDAEVGEDVQRAEDRGPAEPEPTAPRLLEELLGREMATAARDEPGERAAGRGQPVAGGPERPNDCPRIDHGLDASTNRD